MIDKKTFLFILESALLNFDGVFFAELVNDYKIPKEYAEAGIKLCSYLKSINF